MFGNVTNRFTFNSGTALHGSQERDTDLNKSGCSAIPAVNCDDYVMVDFQRAATPPPQQGGPSPEPPTGPRYLRVRALEVPSLESADVSVEAIANHMARATYVGLEYLIANRPTVWVPDLPKMTGSAARFEQVFHEAQVRAKRELETASNLANALVLRTRNANPEMPLETIARAVEADMASAWAKSYQARDANRLLNAVREDNNELPNFRWDARLLRIGARFEAYLDASATQVLRTFSVLKP